MVPSLEPIKFATVIEKATSIILENLQNDQFGVEDLAKQMSISRSQLHRKTKALTGKSVSQLIREVRLEEAMTVLNGNDDITVSEIAYRVGFSSPSYFHRCFQKHFGFSPGEAKSMEVSGELYIRRHVESEVNDENLKTRSAPKRFTSALSMVAIALVGFTIIAVIYRYFYNSNDQLAGEKSVAVLPFESLSTEEENQHFTDGLVDDLLNRLALVGDFKVISRTSSEAFRGQDHSDISDIAKKLGVNYIVEGSVQKQNDQVRIIVQLIDAINDDHIWVKTFDRELLDVFQVQSEIAVQIASGLDMALSEEQLANIQKNQTENVKAMELYQLGRFHWGKRMAQHYDIAIKYFEKAISEDPSYALAYAGLGDTYYLMNWEYTDLDIRMEYRDKAEEYALKALKIDPNLAEALTVLATLNFFIDWDWAAAEDKFVRALGINPNYSTLHFRYAEHLSYTGRHETARFHLDKALELDPLSYVVRRNSTKLYLNQGLFHEALKEAEISAELNRENPIPHWYKIHIYYFMGDTTAFLKSLKDYQSFIQPSRSTHFYDSIFNKTGATGLLEWLINETESSLFKAYYYITIGDNQKTLDWLEKSYNESRLLDDVPYKYSRSNLKSEPRFIALMKKMGLPWKPEESE